MNDTQVETIYKSTISSSNEERVKLIEIVLDFLDSHKIRTSIDRYELYLILDEAISNAMEHGNKWDMLKRVLLSVSAPDKGHILVKVADEGNGFNPKNLPEKLSNNKSINLRGRGIFIMKKFCDVGWNEKANEICLKIKIV